MLKVSVYKVRSRKDEKIMDYASLEYLLNFLKKDVNAFNLIKILKESDLNSVSFTKDKPYRYFYARMNRNSISVILKTLEKEIEFKVPAEEIVC